MGTIEALPVDDEASFQFALLQVNNQLRKAGFSKVQAARFLTAVSELARNILKYAMNGYLQVIRVERFNEEGLEVIAIDNGPGIADIEQALQEQFSSGGTLGQGLPGAKRLVDEFYIESSADGTRVTICSWC